MLKIDGLTVGYGGTEVLCDLSLEIEAGMLTSIVGVNGCGKSTLMRSVIRLLPRIAGCVTVDGDDTAKMSRREIAQRIAYLAQGDDTPDMMVGQLVLHGRFARRGYGQRYSEGDKEIARAAMRTVGIEKLADRRLATLSGGLRQSAYIAMVLAQDTGYVLLDEPTSGLDDNNTDIIKNLVQKDASKRICIISTHDSRLLELADEIIDFDTPVSC